VAAEFAWARDLSLGGLFIALGIVVPYVFHAVGGGHLGRLFLPMYLPVLAAAMLVSPLVAFCVGLLTPALSSLLTGMPPVVTPVVPMLFLMMVELSLMALLASLLHRRLRLNVFVTVVATLLFGRVITGLTAAAFISLPQDWLRALGGFPNLPRDPILYVKLATVAAIPGLIMLLIVVPALVLAVERISLTRAG
jgi:hypothetical protein